MTVRALFLLAMALGLAACEVVFDPVDRSDLYFALSGYLDASADTQWVRVEPLGESVERVLDPLDVVVTLADGASGAEAVLSQMVRTFNTGPAHLFWTTADVSPGRTYRLTVRRPDGAETRATVDVPTLDDVRITLDDGPETCPVLIEIEGAERVVDAVTQYELAAGVAEETRYEFSKLDAIAETDSGTTVAVYYGDDALEMGVSPLPPTGPGDIAPEVVVAVGTDDWPETAGLSPESILFEDSPRIENGLGFVGGVVTRRFPFIPGIGPTIFSPARPCFGPGAARTRG